MDFGDLVLLLVLAFAAVVGLGTVVLRVLGFSPARGAVITVTFLCLGFWNPVGWIVLGLCVYLQVRENKERLDHRRFAQMAAFAGQSPSGREELRPTVCVRRHEICQGRRR